MWARLPVWFRAILTGLLVSGVPTVVWGVLATINLRVTPSVPWSVPVMGAVLWLFWRTVRGERLRAAPLTPRVWRLSLIGGGSAVAAVWAMFAALRGVLHVTPPQADLNSFPIWTVIAAIVMGSAVAGVAEEAGFRGYMQLALERAYGPVAAIGTTSVIFTLIHLSHGVRILPFLPFFLAVAVVYGLLAYLTGSIVPAIVLHFAGDVLMFTMRYVAARQGVAPVSGSIAPLYAIVAAAFVIFSVLLFRQLARNARSVPAMSR